MKHVSDIRPAPSPFEADRAALKMRVDELLKEHGTAIAAAKALEQEADADPVLMRQVVSTHLHTLCSRVVADIVRASNRVVVQSANLGRSSDVSAWAAAVEEGLMNSFRLPGGKLLGDCTKPDLLAGALAYDTLVGDMVVKAGWLRLVAAKLKDDKATVRAALTERALQEARTEARQNPKRAA